MYNEKSCGCIILHEEKVLIIKQNNGDWGFPKGHMEENETEIETARREVKEETNIDVEIISDKKYTMEYYTDKGNLKQVVLFLAYPKNFDLKPQQSEIDIIKWVSIETALNLLTFDNSKKALTYILDIKDR